MTAPRVSIDPGPVAVGTWSGGRFMHFGEPLDDDRFMALIHPDQSIRSVVNADVYGVAYTALVRSNSRCAEERDDDRFSALISPDQSIRTVITADVYGAGDVARM